MKLATQPVTHTPGPWEYEESSLTIVRGFVTPEDVDAFHITAEDHSIAYSHRGGKNDLANARLIASAPELLEALKEAKELIRLFHGDPAWEIYDSSSPEMKRLNAAIAKATGAEGTQGEQR